jgi:ribosome modulation factor
LCDKQSANKSLKEGKNMQSLNFNKRAVQEGAQAYADGKRREANPYPDNTESNRRWYRGYDAQRSHNILIVPVVSAPVPEPEAAPKKTRKQAPKQAPKTATKTAPKATASKKAAPKKAEAAPKKAAPKKTTAPKKAPAKKKTAEVVA